MPWNVVERVREQREQGHENGSRGRLPSVLIGDFILVALVRKMGSVPKVVQTWTGALRVVLGGTEYLYLMEDIVTGEIKEVHVA